MASEFQNTWQSVVTISPPLSWFRLNCVSSRTALEAERELFKSLAEKEPTFAGISHYLSMSVFTTVLWFARHD